MKLSIAIPTRERAEYLEIALRSAIVAADRSECPVEIIVADNASADGTPVVLRRFNDRRIVTVRSERRLSMRENFEFALGATSGSHVVFIGDDDAVLPNGLRLLSRIIARHDPDIVKWRVLNYLWPDPSAGKPGVLKIRPQKVDGSLRMIDPRALLNGFAQARFRSYRDGGMIYHGCVSRKVIERARAGSGGPYFHGSSPDVFTSLQALMVTSKPIIRIDAPVTLGGASPRSNGASAKTIATAGSNPAGSEFARFITESASDPFQCKLPASCKALSMVTLDCLLVAAELQRESLQIDRAAWRRRIARDVAKFQEPERSACVALAESVFGIALDVPKGRTSPAPKPRAAEGASAAPGGVGLSETCAPTRVKQRISSVTYTGGDAMSDVAKAALLLDRFTALHEADGAPVGWFAAAGRVIRQHVRARRLLAPPQP